VKWPAKKNRVAGAYTGCLMKSEPLSAPEWTPLGVAILRLKTKWTSFIASGQRGIDGCHLVIARSEATKQSTLFFLLQHGLLRCARNDGEGSRSADHDTPSCEERSDEAIHAFLSVARWIASLRSQ